MTLSIHEVVVPDIGDSRDVEVAELLVAVGATVAVNAALLVLESDKASVEVTTTVAGVVREMAVQAGDKVVEAQVLVRIETTGATTTTTATAPAAATAPATATARVAAPVAAVPATAAPATAAPAETKVAAPDPQPAAAPTAAAAPQTVEVVVPDLGDAKNVVVAEILVAAGATVTKGQALVVLESDKASMEIEATADGVVQRIGVSAGQEIVDGTVIAVLLVSAVAAAAAPAGPSAAQAKAAAPVATAAAAAPVAELAPAAAPVPATAAAVVAAPAAPAGQGPEGAVYAGPAVRKVARELGVDLTAVTATGPRGRLVKDDVSRYVKQRLQAPPAAAAAQGEGIAPIPTVDFSRFGPIDEQKLPRVQRVGGVNLHRSWLNLPHVTHHDEADITDLEVFRKSIKDEAQRAGVRVTPLAFLLKACASVLLAFPKFNASLGPNKDTLIYKRYFNIGVAVDTDDGLMVPVVKAVEQKGIFQLAREVADLSERTRAGKLKPDEMSGGTFSISSLGILGGTGFTPIINAPEVAILGVARLATKPVWNGAAFVPREMLPLSLSYDHRVVNGADAARFTSALMATLSDMRRTLL